MGPNYKKKKTCHSLGSDVNLVQSFKKQHIDPLGLGLRYRSKDKAMTPEKWQQIYPDADIQIKCHMNIVQTCNKYAS
ncbi:Ger(x)C family spore germination C-terminal domain-containing protein [Bacillus sp. SL00103]